MSSKIFLFMDNVSGSCTDSSHLGWIPIDSVFFEMNFPIEFKLHTAKLAPINGEPTISKIIITKPHCTATPQIFTNFYSLNKSHIIIDIMNVNKGTNGIVSTILNSGSTRFESKVAYVSNFKISGVSDLTERIELTVSSLSITYNPPADSHELDKKSTSGYHFQNLSPL